MVQKVCKMFWRKYLNIIFYHYYSYQYFSIMTIVRLYSLLKQYHIEWLEIDFYV